MRCNWLSLDKGSPCQSCGYQLKLNYESPPIRRCDVPDNDITIPCQHLLEESRAVQVGLCKGKPGWRAINGCIIHGECVIMWPAVPDLSCCEGCGDYVPEST